MSEAAKPEYFIDGYLLKHFNIWPNGINKDDLFYEQKAFIAYLMGVIPSHEDWSVQVDYKIKLQEIKNLTVKDIEISQEDIDLAGLQGRDIEQTKRERLISEKESRKAELNKSFGVKEEPKKIPRPEGLPSVGSKDREQARQEKLWELLNGKGLVESNG